MKKILWVVCVLIALIVLAFLFPAVSSLFVNPARHYSRNSRWYRFLLNSSTAICLFFAGVRIRIRGAEKLPKEGRFLLVSNHRSNFDPIVTGYALRRLDLAFVSKPENFKIPFFGRIIRRCCYLPIDRESPRRALETVEEAAELIRRDEVSFGIYPEGTRNRGTELLLPFHNSVFKIAQIAGVPVVAAVIRGTYEIQHRFPWKRSEVTLDILETIPAAEVQSLRTVQLGSRIREEMLNALEGATV